MPANVIAASNGKANGIFLDGAHFKHSIKNLTKEEVQDWNNVIYKISDNFQKLQFLGSSASNW